MFFREGNGFYSDPKKYPRLSVAQPATHDHPPLAAAWADCWQNIDAGINVDGNRHELRVLMEFAGLSNSEPPRAITDEFLAGFTRAVMNSASPGSLFFRSPTCSE
jgi:4-alpha-glucanotransferase